jgi:hypothetical protein
MMISKQQQAGEEIQAQQAGEEEQGDEQDEEEVEEQGCGKRRWRGEEEARRQQL